MKKLESIRIIATVGGTMWWPQVNGEMERVATFTTDDRAFTRRWTGLRDALLHLVNVGDFQNSHIIDARMSITWRNGKDQIVRWIDVPVCKETEDLFS